MKDAKTTHAVRAAIQRSKATIAELAGQYDLNPKTVMKWRKQASVEDMTMGPTAPRSTVLSLEEEATVSTRCCRWTTACIPCKPPFPISRGRRSIACSSDMTFPACPVSGGRQDPQEVQDLSNRLLPH